MGMLVAAAVVAPLPHPVHTTGRHFIVANDTRASTANPPIDIYLLISLPTTESTTREPLAFAVSLFISKIVMLKTRKSFRINNFQREIAWRVSWQFHQTNKPRVIFSHNKIGRNMVCLFSQTVIGTNCSVYLSLDLLSYTFEIVIDRYTKAFTL